MVNFNKKIALTLFAAALALILGCVSGPMEPGRRALIEKREAWLNTLKAGALTDEVFFLGDKGEIEPVLITVIPFTDGLMAKTAELWPDDKRFKSKIAEWTGKGRVVILVGYYARNLKTGEDFIKDSPLSVRLTMPGVSSVAPDAAEMVDKAFLSDYFPVFTRWDRTVAYSFRTGLGPGSILSVSFPSGSRDISLRPVPTAEAF